MTFTKHVIKRFRERITNESIEVVRFFIKNDIQNSTTLYVQNHIEKCICNGIIYVIDHTNPSQPKVITLYIQTI